VSAGLWAVLAGATVLVMTDAALASTAQPNGEPMVVAPDPAGVDVEGRVVIRCRVGPERTLDECVVASETPAGHGLGQAALRMAREVKINAGTFKPDMVGQTLEIPIRFVQEDPNGGDMPPTAAAAPPPGH